MLNTSRGLVMEQSQNASDLRVKIIAQIAELSKLLGMLSNDDITVQEAREAHIKLSVLISKAFNIPIP